MHIEDIRQAVLEIKQEQEAGKFRHVDWQDRISKLMNVVIRDKQLNKGIARKILFEDLDSGQGGAEYELGPDEGPQAYVIYGGLGEVKVSLVENRIAPVRLFRIASFPQINKEDIWPINIKRVVDMISLTADAFILQEDARLITILNAAASNFENNISGWHFPSMGKIRNINESYILCNPEDEDDIEGPWKIVSQRVPEGEAYIVPNDKSLGYIPVGYPIDTITNNDLIKFKFGWVCDEYLGMAVLYGDQVKKLVKDKVQSSTT